MLRQRRGESSQDHVDQNRTRWRQEKRNKEETKPSTSDLQENEDERRRIQPLLKTNLKAPERSSSCYGELMRGRQLELSARTASPLSPGLSALPSFSNHVGFFFPCLVFEITAVAAL